MIVDVGKLRETYRSLTPGTTARQNHDDCPSGTDIRRRLYVTKSDDNQSLKCFCHNCQQGTVVSMGRGVPRLRSVVPPAPVKGPLVLPANAKGETSGLLPRHELWLAAHGVLKHATDRGAYSLSPDELVFPYVQDDLQGYQIRYLDGRKPKWQSAGNTRAWWFSGGLQLVAEDVVSCYKWHEATGCGYCLMAGHSSAWHETCCGANYVVWLDNDKPSVLEAAESLAQQFGKQERCRAVLVVGGTDPKHYTKQELKQVHDVCAELFKSTPPDGRPYHVFKVWEPGKRVCSGTGIGGIVT